MKQLTTREGILMVDAGVAAAHRRTLRGFVAGAVACAAMVTSAHPAAAATTLGETNNPFSGVTCTGPSTYLQVSTGRTPSYSVPAGGGVITSWSTFAPAGQGGAQVKLGVFRPTGPPPAQYTTVGASATKTLKAGSVNAFPTSIPVQPGDTLGLLIVTGGYNCIIIDTGSPQDTHAAGGGGGFLMWAPSTCTPIPPNRRGGSTWPPRSKRMPTATGSVTSRRRRRSPRARRRRPTRTRSSSGSAPTIPARASNASSTRSRSRAVSPRRRSSTSMRGKHTFAVRAVDPDGHRDPTPAKDKFKVVG